MDINVIFRHVKEFEIKCANERLRMAEASRVFALSMNLGYSELDRVIERRYRAIHLQKVRYQSHEDPFYINFDSIEKKASAVSRLVMLLANLSEVIDYGQNDMYAGIDKLAACVGKEITELMID